MPKKLGALPCVLCGEGPENHEVCTIEREGKPTLEAYMCPGIIDNCQYEEMEKEDYEQTTT